MASSIEPGTSDMSRDRTRVSHSGRVLRNRRYSELRECKRLFTPEIKRCLKDWLVRRRVHPYPSRAEKRGLAQHTGLTYIQICNWFANWRRKLKNVSADDDSDPATSSITWSHRIVAYNDRAEGNVEQLSVASEDNIWQHGDTEPVSDVLDIEAGSSNACMDHSYSSATSHVVVDEPQCLMVSSTTSEPEEATSSRRRPNAGKRRRSRYTGDKGEASPRRLLVKPTRTVDGGGDQKVTPRTLSKWRTSAMNFKPAWAFTGGGEVGDVKRVVPRKLSKWKSMEVKRSRTLAGGGDVGDVERVAPRKLTKWRSSVGKPPRTGGGDAGDVERVVPRKLSKWKSVEVKRSRILAGGGDEDDVERVAPRILSTWKSRLAKPARAIPGGGDVGDVERVAPRGMVSKWKLSLERPSTVTGDSDMDGGGTEEVTPRLVGTLPTNSQAAMGGSGDVTGRDSQAAMGGSGDVSGRDDEEVTPRLLHKWRASAAKYQPTRTNLIEPSSDCSWIRTAHDFQGQGGGISHELEELEAAEALTRLARLHH